MSYIDIAPALLPVAACVSTVNLPLNGTPIIDGYQTNPNDLVLLVGQTLGKQNGLWQIPPKFGTGLWMRPPQFHSGSTIAGRLCQIENGTTYGNTQWVMDAPPAGIVIDTSAQSWAQVSLSVGNTITGGTP